MDYLSQELRDELGRQGPVFRHAWPEYDPELAKAEGAEVVIQMNGELRARLYAAFGKPKEDLESRALADEEIRPRIEGKRVVKVITVPDRLVNIVVK